MVKFAPEYVRSVLTDNFEDAKRFFVAPLISIHYAHLVMLTEQGIVSVDDAHALRVALDQVASRGLGCATYDESCEDLFFYVDRIVVEACGEDVAGRLHTARSRNDIDMTMYRMRQRELALDLLEATLALRRSLLELSDAHRETLFPAHTHTQPAQPTTVAHYLLAVVEQLERDAVRLRAAYATTNRCPLGACAITGSGFRIDRALTSELLGFEGPTGNTYGSIAAVDYMLESVAASAVAIAGIGRVVQDLLLWCTAEFGYLRLEDGFVQGSSIMPQKRNPVALEHARALASKALGQAAAVTLAVHNTPFGDIVDTEDDLQPLVFSMFRDATRAASLVAAAMKGAEFDKARLEAKAAEGGITLTELADTLVREHGLAFRVAHTVAARIAGVMQEQTETSLSKVLADASEELLGTPLDYTEEHLRDILSPRHFVEVRRTPGGPAPAETKDALLRSAAQLEADEVWLRRTRDALAAAETKLRERSAKL